MVSHLVDALLNCPEVTQILVTKNVPENLSLQSNERVTIIENATPKGFGANHNAAFAYATQPFFCPLNPDIELSGNPFPKLVASMNQVQAALMAPMVKAPNGAIEDSVRKFPTLTGLLTKLAGVSDGRHAFTEDGGPFFPDWVAGMFILFRRPAYVRLEGFDERYFLYYEDVDICVRAWQSGLKVACNPEVAVIHTAQRDSHRRFRHMCWHLASMGRYFRKYWLRLPQTR
jgi:GT2 family glycosyltransferase